MTTTPENSSDNPPSIRGFFAAALAATGLSLEKDPPHPADASPLRTAWRGTADKVIPPSHLVAKDVKYVLGCFIPEGQETAKEVSDNQGNRASTLCRNETDGKSFELSIRIERGGKEYQSRVLGEQASAGVYNITSVILDNKPQPLTNSKEIFSALNSIGNENRFIDRGQVPAPQEEGFFNRLMKSFLQDGP